MGNGMTEKNKDMYDFLKSKLDFIRSFFTTVLISLFGLVGFITLNFDKNSVSLNFLVIFGIILVVIIFYLLLIEALKIFKKMKELL
jgi:hypothetical protein